MHQVKTQTGLTPNQISMAQHTPQLIITRRQIPTKTALKESFAHLAQAKSQLWNKSKINKLQPKPPHRNLPIPPAAADTKEIPPARKEPSPNMSTTPGPTGAQENCKVLEAITSDDQIRTMSDHTMQTEPKNHSSQANRVKFSNNLEHRRYFQVENTLRPYPYALRATVQKQAIRRRQLDNATHHPNIKALDEHVSTESKIKPPLETKSPSTAPLAGLGSLKNTDQSKSLYIQERHAKGKRAQYASDRHQTSRSIDPAPRAKSTSSEVASPQQGSAHSSSVIPIHTQQTTKCITLPQSDRPPSSKSTLTGLLRGEHDGKNLLTNCNNTRGISGSPRQHNRRTPIRTVSKENSTTHRSIELKTTEAGNSHGNTTKAGDDILRPKEDQAYRFVFANINGISLSPVFLAELFHYTKDLQADWVGLVETHLDSTKEHVRQTFKSALRFAFGNGPTNCTFAASDINYQSDYKRGGVLQFALHKLAPRTVNQHQDHLGRFTSQTFIGRNSKMLTLITAYRVPDGCKGPSSSYAQQRAMLVTSGRAAQPRQALIQDLIEFIHEALGKGHSIALNIDANESMERPTSGIKHLAVVCGLVDIHQHRNPETKLSSHKTGSTKIDYVLVSMDLLDFISKAGITDFAQGYQTDHRTMFMDLKPQYFQGTVKEASPQTYRSFSTKNLKSLQTVQATIEAEWTRRKMTERIYTLSKISKLDASSLRKPRLAEMWEKLDGEIGIIFNTAERALKIPSKKKYLWSPALAVAGMTRRYWHARLRNSTLDLQKSYALEILRKKAGIMDDGTTDLGVLQQRFEQAVHKLARMKKQDNALRENHIETLIEQKEANAKGSTHQELTALRQLQRAEYQKKCFNNIKQTLHPIRSGTITRVEVPADLASMIAKTDFSDKLKVSSESPPEMRGILKRLVSTKRKDDEEWVTLLDKATIEKAILLYCSQHFNQAMETPFGHGHLAELIGHAGLTEASSAILKGSPVEVPPELTSTELSQILTLLAVPKELQNIPEIPTEISVEEYSKGFRLWKEQTATSPSGRHLGFYRATLGIGQVVAGMCEMLNIVTRTGLTPRRWCRAISILLEKDPGRPSINRLRIIHLFEADYNLFLKTLWARRLVQRGEEYKQFGEAQQGSRKGRTANDAVMLKRLTYDLTRIQRTNLGTFDNDAKACYDRIVNGIAMLAAKRLGMPTTAITTHSGVLQAMEYTIKTTFGESEHYIQGSKEHPLFGTGQGSGASPAVWLSISTVLLSALRLTSPRGMVYSSPQQNLTVSRHSDAFVDDTQNGVNDSGLKEPWVLMKLVLQLQDMAQSWEKLLFCSGGALELSKCSYYIMHWQWPNGLPVLTSKEDSQKIHRIALTSGNNNDAQYVNQKETTEAHKTLGVWIAPDGNELAQKEHLLQDSNRIASLILRSRLSSLEAWTAYHMCWFPAISYSLGTTTLTSEDLNSVQSQSTQHFLQKFGLNKNFPRAVAFGPHQMGGLAMRDLRIEQGIAGITNLLNHVYHSTETGNLILVALHNLQLEAGTKSFILADPLPILSYITPCWLSRLRDFMRQHQIQLEIATAWNTNISRENDGFLMDIFRLSGQFSHMDLINLNAVRLHLQVSSVSDITTADGTFITKQFFWAKCMKSRRSKFQWPRQPSITNPQRHLWTQALRNLLTANSTAPVSDASTSSRRLHTKLGPWIAPPNQHWSCYYDHKKDRVFRPISKTHASCHSREGPQVRRHQHLFHVKSTVVSFSSENNPDIIPAEETWTSQQLVISMHSKSAGKDRKEMQEVESVAGYIKSLPKARQRLLARCNTSHGMSVEEGLTNLKSMILSGKTINIATDGGLSDGQGTFGVVMADAQKDLWESSGPVDGDCTTANSKRSELTGYASSLELLLMLTTILRTTQPKGAPLQLQSLTWMDSSAAGKHLTNLLQKRQSKKKYPHDADLLAHINWLWLQLVGVSHNIKWVKSHQDKTRPFETLPRSAQLNIRADTLASQYRSDVPSVPQVPRSNPEKFPACPVYVVVNGQRATAYVKDTIRYHINGTQMRKYLQKQRGWTDREWRSIDFYSIGAAYNNTAIRNRFQISKLMHGWLNTGQQRGKIEKGASTKCPSCGEINETQEHILRCRCGSINGVRYNALVKLRAHISTTKGSSNTWAILHSAYSQWMNGKEVPTIDLSKYTISPGQMELLQQALRCQKEVGWQHAARGYLCLQWTFSQQLENPRSTVSGIQNQWTKHVIKGLWEVYTTMWAARNKNLHKNEPQAKAIVHSSTEAAVRRFYSLRDTFAASDQSLFDMSLENRLATTARAQKHWLQLVLRYYRSTSTRKRAGQTLLTKFYTIPRSQMEATARLDPHKLEDPPNILSKHRSSCSKTRLPFP